jgi:hypothetical protein
MSNPSAAGAGRRKGAAQGRENTLSSTPHRAAWKAAGVGEEEEAAAAGAGEEEETAILPAISLTDASNSSMVASGERRKESKSMEEVAPGKKEHSSDNSSWVREWRVSWL